MIDLKTLAPISMASGPETLIIEIAPAPEGVAKATMESVYIILIILSHKDNKTLWVNLGIILEGVRQLK